MVVYDVASLKSIQDCQDYWISDFMDCTREDVVVGLVGNKIDKLSKSLVTSGNTPEESTVISRMSTNDAFDEKKVEQSEVNLVKRSIMEEHPTFLPFETSAKTGVGVSVAFNILANEVLERRKKRERGGGTNHQKKGGRRRTNCFRLSSSPHTLHHVPSIPSSQDPYDAQNERDVSIDLGKEDEEVKEESTCCSKWGKK